MPVETVFKNTEQHMKKTLEVLQGELSKLRTGRAHPSLLDHIMVEFYGNSTPLNQTANISVESAQTLTISPWDKAMVPVIEKAIRISDLGLNPTTSGQLIRVPLPPLTEERRRELVKVVKEEGEGAKVAIRNSRRDANNKIKDFVKNKELSEDEQKRAEVRIQKLTDEMVAKVDAMIADKEKELMSI